MLTKADLCGYQQRGVQFVKNNENCALWFDPGLGKTVSTLTAAADLISQFDASKALVIAPLRVAKRVWDAETQTWDHLSHLRTSKIVGTAKQRLAAIAAPADLYTINREQVSWLESQFINGKKQIKTWPWDLVILDESQSFKSQTSQRWRSLRRLRKLFPRCVQLTGTPAPNGYADLWSQLFLLDRGKRLGQTEFAFRERWYYRSGWNEYDWSLKDGAEAQIREAISDIVLSMRAEDYLDLPPVKYNRINVPLSGDIMKVYKRLAREYILETYSGKIVTAVNAAVCRGKLLQLANGSIYVDDKGNYETLHEEKLAALVEVLEGLAPPVLIGYSFRADRERIAKTLDRFLPSHRTWMHLDNDQAFDAFAAGTVDYGLAHPGSTGHGLNDLYKSGSENAVWFGLTDNLEFYQQFNARLTGGHRRSGRTVVIHHILCDDTQDEGTYELITQKGVTQDDLTRNLANQARLVQ